MCRVLSANVGHSWGTCIVLWYYWQLWEEKKDHHQYRNMGGECGWIDRPTDKYRMSYI